MRDINEQENAAVISANESSEALASYNNSDLYDIKGNLITANDSKNGISCNNGLIQRAIDGDKRAFEMLYMQSYRYVFFVVHQFISDDETAYDVMQETFIKIYKSIDRLRTPEAYFGWITEIAKNTARDFIRSTHYEEPLSEQEDYSSVSADNDIQNDVALDIAAVLKKLSSADAELLSLVYYDGMRISAIAKMQGVPATTVYSRFNKAKKNLKAQLKLRGIDRAIYSGGFTAMITTAIRNIIGTALLSLSVAEKILKSVTTGKGKKELAVAKIIMAQQKKTVLKIASCIVAISIITSAIMFFILFGFSNNKSTKVIYTHHSQTTEDYNDSSNPNNFDTAHGDAGGSSDDKNNTYNSSVISDDSDDQYGSSNTEVSSNDDQSDDPGYVDVNKPVVDNTPPFIPEDDTHDNEIINTLGNNPNNVMRTISGGIGFGGAVAKQGDWLYYVQGMSRLVKVKLDGSQKQIIYESPGLMNISNLNVIGDTIYYTNNGIWSIKTDGTDRRQISSKAAYNLLVRGTTGWFVNVVNTSDTLAKYVEYDLYQIDLVTGEVITIVENGEGFGLKTVIDNSLIYVNGNDIYKRDLSTGSEELIKRLDFDSGVCNMCVNGSTFYFCSGGIDARVVEIDINNPDTIKATYPFKRVYNYFDFYGGVFYTSKEGEQQASFYTLQGNTFGVCDEGIVVDVGIYTFDDGYAYYYHSDLTELYRCLPDNTDCNVY